MKQANDVALIVDANPSRANRLGALLASIEISSTHANRPGSVGPDPSMRFGLALVDGSLDGVLDWVARLRADRIELPVIAYAEQPTPALVRAAFQHGAHDFLESPVDRAALSEAVRSARSASTVDDDEAGVACLPSALRRFAMRSEVRPRSRVILGRRWQGETNAEIATALVVSVSTVKTYLREDFTEPLGARNVLDLARAARRWRAATEERSGDDGNR